MIVYTFLRHAQKKYHQPRQKYCHYIESILMWTNILIFTYNTFIRLLILLTCCVLVRLKCSILNRGCTLCFTQYLYHILINHKYCEMYAFQYNSVRFCVSNIDRLIYKAAASLCLSVCTPPPPSTRSSDRNQICTHIRVDMRLILS